MNSEKGFTTIELMTATVILALIMGFVWTVYHFGVRMSRTWQEKSACENQAFLGLEQAAKDLMRCQEIRLGQNAVELLMGDTVRVHYLFTDTLVWRDSLALFHPPVEKSALIIMPVFSDDVFDEEEMNLEWPDDFGELEASLFLIEVRVSSPRKEFACRTSVRPRNLAVKRVNRVLLNERE